MLIALRCSGGRGGRPGSGDVVADCTPAMRRLQERSVRDGTESVPVPGLPQGPPMPPGDVAGDARIHGASTSTPAALDVARDGRCGGGALVRPAAIVTTLARSGHSSGSMPSVVSLAVVGGRRCKDPAEAGAGGTREEDEGGGTRRPAFTGEWCREPVSVLGEEVKMSGRLDRRGAMSESCSRGSSGRS